MKAQFFARSLVALTLATLIQACSGGSGGGTNSAILPPSGPGPGTASNALTTYSVFVGNSLAQPVVDVEPLGTGAASGIAGALPATNAYVVYPDNSVQQVDALGNFDVSKSVWAIQNVNILVANPNSEPSVVVFANSPVNPQPEEVSVNAYAPGGAVVLAGEALQTESSTMAASADLAHVVVFPQSAAMMDNRTRMFHAVGKDTNGSIVLLSKAAVVWSVARAAGCGAPSGKLKMVAGDASTVIYTPPSSGSSISTCPDQIIATLASGSVSQSGSANAFYYDPLTSVRVAGVLKSATGVPAAGAIVNLYGGSTEGNKGAFLTLTDANGKFSRFVPGSRILAPTAALTSDKTRSPFVVISPASINPATAGASLASQVWTMTAQGANAAPKPQPPFADLVRDANAYGNAARESFPFGAPNVAGQFTAGSIEYILAHPAANAGGSSTSGPYSGYAFKWDAAGKAVTFTQPGGGTTKVLTVTLNAPSVNGQPCPSAAACFSYSRKTGSVLELDGAWSQKLTGSAFSTTYVRNDYNSAHQTAGSPVDSHTITTNQTVGTQTITLSDQRFNAGKQSLGTLTINRIAGSGGVLYTYSGTVHALSYKADGSTIAVDYAINNGIENADYSGAFKFSVTASPSTLDVGDAVNFAINKPSASTYASGTVDGAGLSGLISGHAASFVVSKTGAVTLTKDASLLSNVITFQL